MIAQGKESGWGPERGALLKQLRLSTRKTQADLAKAIGVSQTTISNWENGRPGEPGGYIPKIEEFLGGTLAAGAVPAAEGQPTSDLALWLERSIEAKRKTGKTIQIIAAEAGVSAPTLYNIINGTVEVPQARTVEKLQAYFGEVPSEVTEEATEARAVGGLGEYSEFDPFDETQWPDDPGVYVLYDVSDRPIYVGKSANSVAGRLRDHQTRFWYKRPIVARAAYVKVDDAKLVGAVETLLIKVLRSLAVVNQKGVVRDVDPQ